MADGALHILTQLSILLILGLLGTAVAKKMRISNVLLLLVGGLLIGLNSTYFDFEPVFLVALATVTLAIIVFEGTSKLSYRQLDKYSTNALSLTLYFFVFTVILAGIAGYFLFFAHLSNGVLLALILAVALAGTDPSTVMFMLQDANQRVAQLLVLESIINTPLVIVIPFMLLDTINDAFSALRLVEFAQQIVVGIGAGVLLGLIIFKALRRFYQVEISNLSVVAAALLAYILAENLGGSGVLAVATLGVLFSNFQIKRKEEVQEFSFAFSNTLELLIFLLIGIIIGAQLPLTVDFFMRSFALFVILFGARFLATYVSMHKEYQMPEILFASITMPKGIAVAVLIFTFTLYTQIPPLLLTVLFAVSIYSVIAATASTYWWNNRATLKKKK